MKHNAVYPFTAIVGQEAMKLSLILNVINPALGGVLIKGERCSSGGGTQRNWHGSCGHDAVRYCCLCTEECLACKPMRQLGRLLTILTS